MQYLRSKCLREKHAKIWLPLHHNPHIGLHYCNLVYFISVHFDGIKLQYKQRNGFEQSKSVYYLSLLTFACDTSSDNKASRKPTRYSTAVDKPKNLGVSGNRSYKNLYLKTVSKKCVKNSEL